MLSELQPLIDKVWRHCEDKGTRGRTVTLKVKFANFELISRSRTVAGLIGSRGELELVTSNLLKTIFPTKKAVRLLGVSISGFVDAQDESPVQICFNGDGVRQILRRRRLYFPEAASKRITEWRMSS
jgi:DNA polymerase-4